MTRDGRTNDRASSDLDGWLRLAEELASWAIDRIASAGPGQVTTKDGPADVVTETDRAVEQHVRTRILARYPDHAVVGEELGTVGTPHASHCWFVDPVDGTTNYARGLPWSSFSLGMLDGDGPVVGVVADPYRGEVFSAVRGSGAMLAGAPIRHRSGHDAAGGPVPDLAGRVVLTELAGHRVWEGMAGMLADLAAAGCTSRIMGSSALALASTAAGRADAVVLGGYHTWDVLAGVLLAREAGLRVLGADGQDLPAVPGEMDGGLLTAAPDVAAAMWRLWRGAADPGR